MYAQGMFGRNWNRVDAKLIDQRYLEGGQLDATAGQYRYELWEYMVEFPGKDGAPVRLTIKEKSFKLRLPGIGGSVPVLVNPKGTEAKFDFSDETIDAVALNKAEAKAEKQRSADRFQAELSDPGGSKPQRARAAAAKTEEAALKAIGEGDDLQALEAMEAADDALDESRRAGNTE